jgi:hypothetical protein
MTNFEESTNLFLEAYEKQAKIIKKLSIYFI